MWIASKIGFFSIVQKEGFYHVRGRVREDLDALKRAAKLKVKVEEWPDADYRWRLRLNEQQRHQVFEVLEESVDYPNFKNKIHVTPGQRNKIEAYTRLWSELHQLQVSPEDFGPQKSPPISSRDEIRIVKR